MANEDIKRVAPMSERDDSEVRDGDQDRLLVVGMSADQFATLPGDRREGLEREPESTVPSAPRRASTRVADRARREERPEAR